MIINKKILLLILLFICGTYSFAQNKYDTEHANKVISKIEKRGAFVENLLQALGTRTSLPVGLQRTVANNEIVVAIDKVKFRKNYTEFSAFVRIITAHKNKDNSDLVLFFGASGLKMSYDGSIIGEANLSLLQDIEIPFNNNSGVVLNGGYEPGNAVSDTYVSLDCNGYKELSIDADVIFSKSMLRSLNGGDSTVRANFRTIVTSFSDIIAEIDLPRFEIVGLEGFEFEVDNVAFDFSDVRNSSQVTFPGEYANNYLIPGNTELWRGVYAKNISVTLPKQFDQKDNSRTSFQAQNMLIDDNGITGLFSANNILDFSQGDASGWNFSVSGFDLALIANKLKGAGFEGKIGLPFKSGGTTTSVGYTAVIGADNTYSLQIESVDSLDFSIFKAKAQIHKNSHIKMTLADGRFVPEAMLHGSMSIATDSSSTVQTKIPKLEFRSLHLTTQAPYINVEYFGYSGDVSVGKFPVSLSDIELRAGNGNAILSSGISLNLAEGMFGGETTLEFLASIREDNGSKYWQFDGVRLNKIGINATIAEVLNLKGEIGWRRSDPIYGDGFYGDMELNIDLKGGGKLGVGVGGSFGIVDGMRYWYVNGTAILPPPGIGIGAVGIRGFAGSVAYRMKPAGINSGGSSESFAKQIFVPDKNTSLYLQSAVKLTIAETANGEASFDITFSKSGGVSNIGFYGYVEMAKTIKTPGIDLLNEGYQKVIENEKKFLAKYSDSEIIKKFKPNDAAKELYPIPSNTVGIYGNLGVQYDFNNRTLFANSELYVTSPGDFITGSGSNGRAGWFTLYVAPDDWYMHMGTPDDRIGLKVGIAGLYVKSGGYLMAGSRIPPMPPPPQSVADILGTDLSNISLGRNIEALSTGKGFALGFDFGMDTGNINFLILYARFNAGIGFDLMYKDYGSLYCAETGNQIGLDGWFAQGQAYSYLQGEVGVNVNLGFIKKRIPVLKGGAATLLQATFPNPSSFSGNLRVRVEVLGGLIKGDMKMKLEIGDKCTPLVPGGSPLKMEMISDLAPSDGESSVSVFTMPQATFTMPINKAFEAEDNTGTGTYRIALKSLRIEDSDGNVISGEYKWNSAMDAVSLKADEILPPNQTLLAVVEVSFEEFENGIWRSVTTAAEEAVERREVSFTTSGAPDYIPLENLLYTYPVVDQNYFLTKENSSGFMQLDFGQNYLFEKGFNYELHFVDSDNKITTVPFNYDASQKKIEFTTPTLNKNAEYTVGIYYSAEGGDENSSSQSNVSTSDYDDYGEVSVSNKTAQLDLSTDMNSIIEYKFSTSKFSTFKDKMRSIDTEGKGIAEDAGIAFRYLYDVNFEEPFEPSELVGVDKTDEQPLIRAQATLEEPFYRNVVMPQVYDGYPFGGAIRLKYRDDNEVGVPPINSVFVYQPYVDRYAQDGNIKRSEFPYSYETAIIYERDFMELQGLVVNSEELVDDKTYERFITGRLPFLQKGKYKAIFEYVLPDGTVSSVHHFYFNNFLRLNE